MKRYIKTAVFTLLLSLTVGSCGTKTEKTEITATSESNSVEVSSQQFENSSMALGKISTVNFNETVKTNGYVDVPPANKAEVSAVMGGYVKRSPFLVGDKVVKGQLLLTIENPDFIEIQQNYLEISEQLTYLKSEYERQKTLFEEKITSQKSYLKAESDYKSAKAMYNGLAEKLRMLRINTETVKKGNLTSVIAVYAPISGVISAVYASVGKFMNTSDVLMEIINDEHKHLELTVFEKDALKIKEDQTINFKIPETSQSKSYEAKVHLIGKAIDKDRTVKVHGHLVNENEPFLVGMFVEASIVTSSKQIKALPLNAVLEDNDNYFVLVLNSKENDVFKFDIVKVETGLKNEDFIQILNTDELKEKEILTKGAFLPVE